MDELNKKDGFTSRKKIWTGVAVAILVVIFLLDFLAGTYMTATLVALIAEGLCMAVIIAVVLALYPYMERGEGLVKLKVILKTTINRINKKWLVIGASAVLLLGFGSWILAMDGLAEFVPLLGYIIGLVFRIALPVAFVLVLYPFIKGKIESL